MITIEFLRSSHSELQTLVQTLKKKTEEKRSSHIKMDRIYRKMEKETIDSITKYIKLEPGQKIRLSRIEKTQLCTKFHQSKKVQSLKYEVTEIEKILRSTEKQIKFTKTLIKFFSRQLESEKLISKI